MEPPQEVNLIINKFFKTILLLTIMGALLTCSAPHAIPKNRTTPPHAEAGLIHWNDFHAANIPYQPTYRNPDSIYVGGYANLAGYIDSLQGVYPGAITLHAGDDFQGSPISSLTKGKSQIQILNQIRPTAFTIGNHEFDYGVDNLKECLQMANFNIISANIYDTEARALFTEPYIMTRSNAVRIAVIGLIAKDFKSSVLPGNARNINALDPLTQTQKYVAQVNAQADLIILLTHQGYYADSLLATQVSEVDIIIGGHSHSWLSHPRKVNDILICQAGGKGERLGLLKMVVDTLQNKIVSYDYEFIRTRLGRVSPSQQVARVVDSLEATIQTEMDRVIGYLETPWMRSSRGESNIGNWIADALRKRFNTDIALQNSGGIRKSLEAGPIKVRDLWEISPFDNTVLIMRLNGRQLKKLLEWRIKPPRDLLQVSGLTMVYNSRSRQLIKAQVNEQTIQPEKTYTIATNNYITGHMDRFFGLTPTEVKLDTTGIMVRSLLIEAVQQQGKIRSETENRLIDRAQ